MRAREGTALLVLASLAACGDEPVAPSHPAPARVEIEPSAVTVEVGADTVLRATVFDGAGRVMEYAHFTWRSEDTTAVPTSGQQPGMFYARGPSVKVRTQATGTVGVTARAGEATGRAVVTIRATRVHEIRLSPASRVLRTLGDTLQLTAEALSVRVPLLQGRGPGRVFPVSGAVFSWRSSDETVATVDETGLVRASGSGVATISAGAQGVWRGMDVAVELDAEELSLSPVADTLWASGQTVQLAARPVDIVGKAVAGAGFEYAWSSSDASVATVGDRGLVTAVAEGSAEITARDADADLAGSVTVVVDLIDDREALVAFFHATGGSGARPRGWLSDAPLGSWEGVTTGEEDRVTELVLRDRNLRGRIPAQVAALSSLVVLDLSHNELDGPIPVELEWLDNLRTLALASNELTGPVPPELGNLGSLRSLHLGYNALTGPIPSELGNLRSLESLHLGYNALTGPIPRELGQLGNLQSLHLSSNVLTGPIPPELGNLGALTTLDLGFNRLTGEIPPSLGDLSGLAFLTLRGNRLAGPVPAGFGSLASLRRLDLSSNLLTGEIPPELGNLAQLRTLWLYRNYLTGVIPPELGRAAELWNLDLSYNHLTGAIPPELGGLWDLGVLKLNNNRLTGEIPPELGDLSFLIVLYLHVNSLTGAIPPELGSLAELEELNLYLNDLTGPIPPSLGNLRRLKEINLNRNRLTGPIPAELQGLEAIEVFVIGSNELTDTFPRWLGHLENLRLLSMNFQGLTGPIPPELGSHPRLESLNLHQTGLSGSIPPELGNLTTLVRLSLAFTDLSGPIPRELMNTPLEVFWWSETDLCAPADDAFQAWIATFGDGGATCPLNEREILSEFYEATGGPDWTNRENWMTDEPLSSWHGIEVDDEGRVTGLGLRANGLAGAIPSEIKGLEHLKRLDLRDNRLSGELPSELGLLAKLEELYLSGNRLTGRIPSELADLSELKVLHLSGNGFTGALPGWLVSLEKLSDFRWDASGLCAPDSEWFRAWLHAIENQQAGAACASALLLSVVSAHLNQAAQNMAGDVPLVAGRDALLRVIVAADRANDHRPRARAVLFRGGREVHRAEMELTSPRGIPEEPDPGQRDQSFEARIPGNLIAPGLALVVEVDPAGTVPKAPGSRIRVPAHGRLALDVREMPHMQLTVVPVRVKGHTGARLQAWNSFMDGSAARYMAQVLPVLSYGMTVGEEFTTSVRPSTSTQWRRLLQDINLLRLTDGGQGYYYGVIDMAADAGQTGLAILSGRTSIGVANAGTLAHELGHSMSLEHAPCGFVFDADPDYPYPDGTIGAPGYDARSDELLSPSTADVMSYCSPRWIGDYHFRKAMTHRLEHDVEPPSAAASAATDTARVTRLLLWGDASPEGGLHLEPAFVIEAPPKAPSRPGPYRLEGFAADGTTEFSFDFGMDEVGHGEGGGFLFTIPFEEDWTRSLARIVLTGPEGRAELNAKSNQTTALVLDRGTGRLREVLRGEDAAGAAAAVAAEAGRGAGGDPDTRILVSYGLPGGTPN